MWSSLLQDSLTSKNGFVRKGARAALAVPKWAKSWQVCDEDFTAVPPVLANSFPKSGTHLLAQILAGLPARTNYGAFLGSETSSFQLRERSTKSTLRFIGRFVPGEIVRGHLYYEPEYSLALVRRRAVNYFIYRDPRDVVVSEAHYLREMNRWHRLHKYFRAAPSLSDAIMISIDGLNPPIAGINYPDIASRFSRYQGWLEDSNCLPVRFEDLVSDRQLEVIWQAAEFYSSKTALRIDVEQCAESMASHIAPHKSHTFRSGKKSGWQLEFTTQHSQRFAEVAGDLLIRLGYETNFDWVYEAESTS